MVRVFFFLVLLGSFSSLHADEYLSADVSLAEKQYGQYFRVTLEYRGEEKLEDIDLNEWIQHVAIYHEDEYQDINDDGQLVQIKKLRLYPRQKGKLTLSPVSLGKAASKPLNLLAISPRVNNFDIDVKWEVSATHIWQRQAMKIMVTLKTADYNGRLVLDVIQNTNITSHVYNVNIEKHSDNYYHTAGWSLHPLASGEFVIDLPAIRYQLSGSDQRRFHLPIIQMHIDDLPVYIPPTLPVGKFTIDSRIVELDDTLNWEIIFHSDAIMHNGNHDVENHLARISGHKLSEIDRQYNQHKNELMYRIQLPDWLFPIYSDTQLSIRYFNPVNGKLQTLIHKLPKQWIMPSWAWAVLWSLFLISSGLLIARWHTLLINYVNHLHLHRKIKQLDEIRDIRKEILDSYRVSTLAKWAQTDSRRQLIAKKINQAVFSNRPYGNNGQLKREILDVL